MTEAVWRVREECRQRPRDERRDALELERAHARGEQTLVRVARRGVHQEEAAVLRDRLREPIRPRFLQHVAPAARRLRGCEESKDTG